MGVVNELDVIGLINSTAQEVIYSLQSALA